MDLTENLKNEPNHGEPFKLFEKKLYSKIHDKRGASQKSPKKLWRNMLMPPKVSILTILI